MIIGFWGLLSRSDIVNIEVSEGGEMFLYG